MNANKPQPMTLLSRKFHLCGDAERKGDVYEVRTKLVNQRLFEGPHPAFEFEFNSSRSVPFYRVSIYIHAIFKELHLVALAPVATTAQIAPDRFEQFGFFNKGENVTPPGFQANLTLAQAAEAVQQTKEGV